MKTISIITIVILFIGQISFAAPILLKQQQIDETKTVIAKKIGNDFPKHLVNDSKSAEVIFSVNSNGEIYVKQVKHVEKDLALFIKEKLQGTVIESIKNTAGETFSIVINLMMF